MAQKCTLDFLISLPRDRQGTMTGELLARLLPWYDETPAAKVRALGNHPTSSGFGATFNVRAIVTHVTEGWPRRERVEEFVRQYTGGNSVTKAGLGPQLFVSGDGTAMRVFDLNRKTGHASYVNRRAIGVETANLKALDPPPNAAWIAVSGDADDIAGMKLWIGTDLPWHPEVGIGWYTTATYTGPGFGNFASGIMLYTEQQYRTWALLARYLLELFTLPRNFPVLPHAREAENHNGAAAASAARRIILCDETAEMMKRKLMAAPFSFPAASFATDAAFQAQYDPERHPASGGKREFNGVWREFILTVNGVFGHSFCGNDRGSSKTECPGGLFDVHRLAREVWDFWWYPFSIELPAGSTVTRRPYHTWGKDTPLVEYYWEEDEGQHTGRITPGIHGRTGAPHTFSLDEHSPIYAMADGELVAARFPIEPPLPVTGVSMAFALVRHELYHERIFPDVLNHPIFGPIPFPSPAFIDYNVRPSCVYTLYMHLGRPEGMNLFEYSKNNPDWLNRVLIRLKECELGLRFYTEDPTHHDIDQRAWDDRPTVPSGTAMRPTLLEGWMADKASLSRFMNGLRAGDVAVAPREPWTQSIRVLLGDFLGDGGVINTQGGPSHGIRVETFSPSFSAPGFRLLENQPNWDPPIGPPPPCMEFTSEWAAPPDAAERARLESLGVDPALVTWWPIVALVQSLDPTLSAAEKLPFTGRVIHYDLFSFLSWINRLTWEHEWDKFGILDTQNQRIADAPSRPRPRRTATP
jgi:hypothetical protein